MKKFLDKDVFDATLDRLTYIFSNFDHVVIAFSGGKDSGVLLELVYQFYRKNNPTSKVSVYHIDYEGGYIQTKDYVKRLMSKCDEFDYYHICMPISAACGVSMYQSTWIPWDPTLRSIWVSQPPSNAITIENHEFEFFYVGMKDYVFQKKLGRWLHQRVGASRTAVLVGIRAQESLNRYYAVARKNTDTMFNEIRYSKKEYQNIFNFYPLYDWKTEDIWTLYSKYDWEYNRLYDLYYQAGVPISDMRIANLFHDCGIHSLKLYRAIEPATWSKLIGRV